MNIEQKNPPKKEGGALSAISTLFTKKTASSANLSAPATDLSTSKVENSEKKNAALVGLGITFSEDGAGDRLGISADDVRWLRKELLKSGEDFTREGGFVRITGQGLTKLEAELALGTTLICIAANLPNPQLVLAHFPGQEQIVRVRVADSSAWCKGMLLRDCKSTENTKIWVCEARPRFKGRI